MNKTLTRFILLPYIIFMGGSILAFGALVGWSAVSGIYKQITETQHHLYCSKQLRQPHTTPFPNECNEWLEEGNWLHSNWK